MAVLKNVLKDFDNVYGVLPIPVFLFDEQTKILQNVLAATWFFRQSMSITPPN